jgi:hypothetical protein
MLHSPPRFSCFRRVGFLAWMAATGAIAQSPVPNTLRHSFFAPQTAPQEFEKQGMSLALDGDFAIVGAPFFDADPVTGLDTGKAKVYRVSTGQLLHLLESPGSEPFAYFGQAVAISGSIVAVGSGSSVDGLAYAGRVDLYDLASPTPKTPFLSLENPVPGERDQFGHSLAIDGSRLVVGAWLDDTGGTDSGFAYVYDIGSATPDVPVFSIPNPSPAEGDCFGVAVALDGDRLVVSAYLDDAGAVNSGRAYVFDLASSNPGLPTTVLSRPGAAVNDGFGSSLALSGDKVVVGVENADATLADSGSAIVYDLSSPVPGTPLAILQNPAPSTACYFGTSVSISGNTVAVGAYRDSTFAGNGGTCHVYNLAGPNPELPVHTLKKQTPASGDLFGNAVSVSGSRVLVGASHDDTGDDEAGSSYLFDISTATPLVPLASFSNPVKGSADRFGAAVAIHGDRVVIGSPDSDAGSSAAGRVRIHDLASAEPGVAVATVENPEPAAGDRFGAAVAISGARIAVGATGVDGGAADAGKVYLHDLLSVNPGQPLLSLSNPHPAASDRFGSALSLSGNRLIVGVGDDDESAVDSGRAYLYDLAGTAPAVPTVVLANPSPAAGDRFGASVSVSGDLVVVGAPGDDTTAADAGSVYVFDLSGNLLHTLAMPSAAAGDAFGASVAVSAGRVAAGAPGADAGATDAGRAAVFLISGPAPTVPDAVIGNPAPAAGDQFGLSIAVSGARVVVGAMLDDSPADSGRVHSFNMASSTPTVPSASLAKPVPVAGDLFGASVGVDGLIIVVGTPSDNKTAADKGAAYVFGPAAPEIALKGPDHADLHGGDSVTFGAVAMGPGGGGSMVFKILNTGITGLSIDSVTVVGGNAADFSVTTAGMVSPVPPGDDTDFTVTLSPSAPGHRSTTLRIANSDSDENPFEIALSGHSLSPDQDTDGDGLNDVAELRMSALGFNWQVADPSLAAVFNSTANQAGLFRPDQVRSLRVPPPSLARGPGSGEMTLTIWLEKGVEPSGYVPFPLVPADTSFNPEGELEFLFSVPDDTGLFRLETR